VREITLFRVGPPPRHAALAANLASAMATFWVESLSNGRLYNSIQGASANTHVVGQNLHQVQDAANFIPVRFACLAEAQ
jgi:hypothetical protein